MNDTRTYGQKLSDPRWQRKRLEVMERDAWQCVWCHDDKVTLNVHHLYYQKSHDLWQYPMSAFITLCQPCHDQEQEGLRRLQTLSGRYCRHGVSAGQLSEFLEGILQDAPGIALDDCLQRVLAGMPFLLRAKI